MCKEGRLEETDDPRAIRPLAHGTPPRWPVATQRRSAVRPACAALRTGSQAPPGGASRPAAPTGPHRAADCRPSASATHVARASRRPCRPLPAVSAWRRRRRRRSRRLTGAECAGGSCRHGTTAGCRRRRAPWPDSRQLRGGGFCRGPVAVVLQDWRDGAAGWRRAWGGCCHCLQLCPRRVAPR